MKNLRDEVLDKVLTTKKNHIVLEVATGVGKTRLALEKISQLYSPDIKVLIVIPRNVLIQNWIDEFKKWGYEDMVNNVTFVTYVSLPKMAGYWDICVFDEAHHLSDRCRFALGSFHITHAIFLSATLKKDHLWFIDRKYGGDTEYIRVNTKKAIDSDVLPDPKILLVPLTLDNKDTSLLYVKRKPKHGETPLIIPYAQKWKYKKYKGALSYQCTQRQYYNELSGLIEWYKQKRGNPVMKNMWLHKCGERLQWLSSIKLPVIRHILGGVANRCVVFCNTIEDSEMLQIPAVNSKIGFHNLNRFNSHKINSIVAVNCLNEGINLSDCQVGVFDAINASEIMQIQKMGRLLRHKNPVLIIPYFTYTREQEIVEKWIQNYNEKLIYRLGSIGDIPKYIK